MLAMDRAAGVLLGQACGDALGVPYEFGPRLTETPQMTGGGLGPYEPGEWSDDTQMAICIGRVAETGANLAGDDALDQVADGFLNWQANGASDIGNQTRRVLNAARRGAGGAGARLIAAAADDLKRHPDSAGNGALMRTSIVGISAIDDRDSTAAAARAVAALTHPADDAVDSCVLWSEAVRRAVVDGAFNLVDGLDLLPERRRDRWRDFVTQAETASPDTFAKNGWTVTALQAAWSAIVHTPVPELNPSTGSFPCLQLQQALTTAIQIGHDTDTVAAIAGGLLGARWGVSALPARWRRIVHGWPGLRSRHLVAMAALTAKRGASDSHGWPEIETMVYPRGIQHRMPHPADDQVLLGTVSDLGQGETAAVSLCRLGTAEVPTAGVQPKNHVEFWLIDSDDPEKNANLDFVLADVAGTIAVLRDEDHRVLLHCMAAQQRTPSAALAYANYLGLDPQESVRAIAERLESTRGSGLLWSQAAQVAPRECRRGV